MVFAMALLTVAFYALGIVALIVAFASQWASWLLYANALILLVMLYTQVAAIPLTLNWSRNLYGVLLKRLSGFIGFTIVIYMLHHYYAGVIVSGALAHNMADAFFLSAATWTTIGTGQISPVQGLRFGLPLQALTALLTTAVLVALIWLYCEERLKPRSLSDPEYPLRVQFDPTFGVFRELDSDDARESRRKRTAKLQLHPCDGCGAAPEIERYWDVLGRTAPLPKYVTICGCGRSARMSQNAYLAAYRWNALNADRKPEPDQAPAQ